MNLFGSLLSIIYRRLPNFQIGTVFRKTSIDSIICYEITRNYNMTKIKRTTESCIEEIHWEDKVYCPVQVTDGSLEQGHTHTWTSCED